MAQKIEGKFYPLQHGEWVKACQELTPAQRDVLYFVRTLDPYNMGLDITAAEIARQLSKPNRIVHRQTVSRALKELDRLGFIDLELISISIKVLPKGVHCQQVGANETPVVPGDTKRDRYAPNESQKLHQIRMATLLDLIRSIKTF